MVDQHQDYHYSVTMHSDDLAVVNCLRALAQYSQKHGNNRIPWSGTKDKDWENHNHCVTFHFTSSNYRSGFLKEVKRLLPSSLWSVSDQSDNNPATPQS